MILYDQEHYPMGFDLPESNIDQHCKQGIPLIGS